MTPRSGTVDRAAKTLKKPTFPPYFGRNTKSRRSRLSGVYSIGHGHNKPNMACSETAQLQDYQSDELSIEMVGVRIPAAVSKHG